MGYAMRLRPLRTKLIVIEVTGRVRDSESRVWVQGWKLEVCTCFIIRVNGASLLSKDVVGL